MIDKNEQALYTLWSKNHFHYVIHTHFPIFTVEEGLEVSRTIPGAHSKNLFLKDKKGNFFLVSVLQDKRVDLKALSKEVGKGGLSFGSALDLHRLLQLVPGSVTPFGLIHTDKNTIQFILDEDFLAYDDVNFHPLRNDKTVQMKRNDFLKFFTVVDHVPLIRAIPVVSTRTDT